MEVNLYQLYEQHYFFEVERRDQLDGKVALPLGVLTVLAGGWLAMLSAINTAASSIITHSLAVGLAISAASGLVTAVMLALAYFNYEYIYVSSMKELDEHREKLIAHFGANGIAAAEKDFLKVMLTKYANAQHRNARNNDLKSRWLYRSTGALLVTTGLIGLTAVPFSLVQLQATEVPQKIEIVNLPRITNSAGLNNGDSDNARINPSKSAKESTSATSSASAAAAGSAR